MKNTFGLTAVLLLACATGAQAQTFSSGSTGADGAFNPPAGTTQNITVRAGGVYHYTTFNVPFNTTVEFFRGPDNAPVVILATGDVTISGSVNVRGLDGNNGGSIQQYPGGNGGPGGFKGGNGGLITSNPPLSVAASAGQGPGGGGASTGNGGQGGQYGAPTQFVLLTPLFGGSGGGAATPAGGAGSASGGGGAGAILIASSTRIVINGAVRANGGTAGVQVFSGCAAQAGAGSGGAIRLVAPTLEGSGVIQALRGFYGGPACGNAAASDGRIRVEAFNTAGFTGVANPPASVTTAPGAVSPAGNPALANVPTLQFASIGGLAVPANPAAQYGVADVTLPAGTANPVPVVLNATNTPVGPPTVITVRLIPQGAATSVAVAGTDHTGTFASSSATANVNLPAGQVLLLQAHAAMTLTGQTASLFPLIDGEPVEQVALAAEPGQPSTLTLVTKSGKERRLDQLPAEDQLRVAQAWSALRQ